jgi:transglutaminase-like putative cysteine protease
MRTIQIGCDLTFSVTSRTSFLFNVAAARTNYQNISTETLQLSPNINYETKSLGTEAIQIYRLTVDPCEFQLQYRAKLELRSAWCSISGIIEGEYAELPIEVLPYLNPSRYCESDRLGHFAARLFDNVPPGFSRVTAICDWINNNIDYQLGSSNVSTSACDVLIQRTGVCRDYAHLAIAFCRALCIPARYISGYAVDLQPPDFHGFFEAYLGSRWYLFDATCKAPLEGFVRIGTGRDAADTSFATIIGEAMLTKMAVFALQTAPSFPPNQIVLSQTALSTTD